ncbi:MAG: hypothetical protein HFF90_10015 [Oscillibacter sp.]|nr:hypothetical protein [Oscillibacter sp.]
MRLLRVDIDGYKHLRKMSVAFAPPRDSGLLRDAVPIRFLIGLNGSGKSAFLEGLCLIFSRLAQNESPGFAFRLVYEIQRAGQLYQVDASGGGGKELSIRAAFGKKEIVVPSFTQDQYLLPDRIFVCASGNNNNFFDIAVRSPRDALHGELFDASQLGKSRHAPARRREDAGRVLRALRRLEEDPVCLLIDEQASVLALAAFLSIPEEDDGAADSGTDCRGRILKIPDSRPLPLSFSLTVDMERLRTLQNRDEADSIFQELEGCSRRLSSWITARTPLDDSVGETEADRVMTFLFEGGACPRIESLTDICHSPVDLLSKLIRARNQGLIREAHLSFHLEGSEDVLEESALSEGEYMLLVRLGLLAMGRGRDSQFLYLLDEPDVYLNERWNIDFVSTIHELYRNKAPRHEILAATHSSLVLTDACPEQLYCFSAENGTAICRNVQASTFGGSRNEIMQALFQTKHSVGSFSFQQIERLLETAESADELEQQLEDVGSGYLRLRVLARIERMKEEEG